MDLTLIRHAEPERGATDAGDPGLSEVGRTQAIVLARRLCDEPVDVIYTSPQLRALQTAEVVAEHRQLPLTVEPALVEFDYGAAYVHFDDPTATVWASYLAGDLSPWGLTKADFHRRVGTAMAALAHRHAGQRVLAVCHGGVINAWACQVFGVPERIRVLEPAYVSLHRFTLRRNGWRLVSLNEGASLPIRAEALDNSIVHY